MRRSAFANLAIVVLLAGCSGSSSSGGPAASSDAIVPTATAGDDTGSISGLVTDAEALPVAGAEVALIGTVNTTATDASGRFAFNDLLPGPYTLVANRVGYAQAGKKVQVVAGEIVNVTLNLESVVLEDEAYTATDVKVAYFRASWLYLTYGLWGLGVNDSNVNQLQCDPCRFTLHFEPGPKDVLTETSFRNSVTYPVVNNQVWLYYATNDADGYGDGVLSGYFKHRSAVSWSEEATKAVKGGKVGLWVNADLAGVNYEQRVETFTSFAYGAAMPDGFTALPPP